MYVSAKEAHTVLCTSFHHFELFADLLGGKFKEITKSSFDNRRMLSRKDIAQLPENKPNPTDKECFPGTAMLTVHDDGTEKQIPMSNLKVGDLVKTIGCMDSGSKIGFSQVLLFAHHLPKAWTSFKEIHLRCGHVITLSPWHLVFINNCKTTKFANEVKIDDILILESGQSSSVEVIKDVVLEGAFCPITMEGTILVDGVLASCYANCSNFRGIDGHRVAHGGLLPIRIMAKMKRKKLVIKKIPSMHPYIMFLVRLRFRCMQ